MAGLEELKRGRPVIVCLGCGGVGKTTVAASISLRAALRGRRALCLTIDPARRLATSLGIGAMRSHQQRVEPAFFSAAGLAPEGELWAAIVDAKTTFDQLVQRLAPDRETAERILSNRIYRHVSASMPGVQEYMAMERLCSVKESPDFDLVVLDTPPTAHALDFLDAPRRVIAAIDSPAVQWLLAMRNGGALSRGMSFVLRQLSRLGGTAVIERMADLASDFEGLFGALRQRAAAVDETLRSDEVAFVLVTSPAPSAVEEAIFLHRRLVQMGLQGGALVINRIRPLRPGAAQVSDQDIRRELERAGLSQTWSSGLAVGLHRALSEEQSMAREDERQVERLTRSCKQVSTVCLVPSLDRDVYDLGQLARLHTWLFPKDPKSAW